MMRLAAALLLCGGCTVDDVDLRYVSVGASGSIHGGDVMTIYENGHAVYEGSSGTPDSVYRKTETLTVAVYEETRAVAVALIADLELTEPLCMDFGTEFITVYDGPNAITEAKAYCPNDAMRTAQIAVQTPRDLATGALIE